ncbi:MAG: RidA family protein [Alphaproteobacteria bacterium]
MSETPEARLAALAIALPSLPSALANYLPVVQVGTMLYLSGQLPRNPDGSFAYVGKLGANVSPEDGQAAARMCAINIISLLKATVGELSRIERIVKLGVFVASTEEFTQQPVIANGASDLMMQVFGERGGHTRSAVGVISLPGDAPVEIDAIVSLSQ